MCLIVFAWKAHPKYPLILASNRDEFYKRPTLAAHQWLDHNTLIGGRDKEAHGTWLAVNEEKKIAAVTNYRDVANIKPDARSRGELPVNFLLSSQSGKDYMLEVESSSSMYNGFNLLLFEGDEAYHYSNYEGKINTLKPGVYGLSNALLDTPWPKVERVKKAFSEVLKGKFTHDDLISMMQNPELAQDEHLPQTGLEHSMEKALSAICIRTEGYGTCCSTVITKDNNGLLTFTEKSYPVGGRKEEECSFELR